MEIELNHFKTRAVFDRISKQYQDISFIQDTEQVHTHDHIYQFVTPDMKGKLDNIKRISAQEFNSLQEPLEDGFYIYDDKGLLIVTQVEENSSNVSVAYIILEDGVQLYKWNTNSYEAVGNVGELDINLDQTKAIISSIITPTDTSEVEIPAATTTTAGLLSASDKVKINNTIRTCTAQEADGITLDQGLYYCPERNTLYYFFVIYPNDPNRIRLSIGGDTSGGGIIYQVYIKGAHQWGPEHYVGQIQLQSTPNAVVLTQDFGNGGIKLLQIPNVTTTAAGCMTPQDKVKLDNIREFTEEKEEVIAHSLNDLNSRVTELSENNASLNEDIEETERVISLSLNDLNSRLSDLNSGLNKLNETVEENELITASALNDLNERIQNSSNNSGSINWENSNNLLRIFIVPGQDDDGEGGTNRILQIFFINETIESIKNFCRNQDFLPKEIITMFGLEDAQFYTLDNVSTMYVLEGLARIHCNLNFSGLSGDFEVDIDQNNSFSLTIRSSLVQGGETYNTESPIQIDNCLRYVLEDQSGEELPEDLSEYEEALQEYGLPLILFNSGLLVKVPFSVGDL